MNPDDDTFLSAYLDGQLDPEEQHLVESALVSRPELAERLRRLTSLRDLVASLNRDFPIDVTAGVMGRVCARQGIRSRMLPRLVWLRTVYSGPRAAVAAGIAAGLLLSVTLVAPLLMHRSNSGHFRPLVKQGLTHEAPRRGLAADLASQRVASDLNAADPGATSEAAADGDRESGSGLAGRRELAGAAQGTRISAQAHTLEHYRQLLDNPNQRRLFRISDGGDGKALQQVQSVVENTTRFGFYKITISQGIVIDPRHPEEATVYVALVSAKGLDTLRDRLVRALPDRVDESLVALEVVTQLADIGQVHGFRSAPFGDVVIPRDGLALQNPPDPEHDVAVVGADGDANPSEQPTIEQERSAPIGEEIAKRLSSQGSTGREPIVAQEPRSAPAANARALHGAPTENPAHAPDLRTSSGPAVASRRRERPEDTFVVLVWVARSHHG